MENTNITEKKRPNYTLSDDIYSAVMERIVEIDGKQVIADADVAALYGVETKRINEAVKNNPDKFPSDYMFELTDYEKILLRSKISTTKVSPKSRATTKD